MKKQIIILLLIIIHLSAWSQKDGTANSPCTEDMPPKAIGNWIHRADNILLSTADMSKADQLEAKKRMDQIHQMMVKIYPQPIGVDAMWHYTFGINYFASQVKYFINSNDQLDFNFIKEGRVSTFYYTSVFPAYYCAQNKLWPGSTNESHTNIQVAVNSFASGLGKHPDDAMTIEGRQVKMRLPVKQMWNGYEVLHGNGGAGRYVFIHRKGILPYIPVTRKQYLDYTIDHQTKYFDKLIKELGQMPVRTLEEQETEKKNKLAKFEKDFGKDPKRLKSAVDYYLSGYQTDQQRRDEQVNKIKKNKDDVLKSFKDELEKTTKEGLLDSPAIVLEMNYHSPVFTTEAAEGHMLVTENPEYMRKDLPKYVPQLFVLNWNWNNTKVQEDIAKIIEEKFPIEKLQAMIDK